MRSIANRSWSQRGNLKASCDAMLLAFIHIEKTGGTTLNQVLRRNFLFRFVDVRPLSSASDGEFRTADLEKYRRINPFIAAISGHAISPIHASSADWPAIRCITLLRDPAKRYVSQYLYFVRIGKCRRGFERFLEQDEFANFQTRKLAGNGNVDEAIASLKSMFVAGAVEEFDAFLLRLRNSLRPRFLDPRYVVKNVGDSRTATDILNRFRFQIEERNLKDRLLYQYLIEDLVPRANANYDGDLATDLREFKERNLGFRLGIRDYLDFAVRKFYYEPVSGIMRRASGLPAAGSY